MKLYVAGPMSGLPEHNYPAFHSAAAELRKVGFEVVGPAEIAAPYSPEQLWEFYMRLGIKALLECEAVAVRPRWEWSRGAAIEVELAKQLGMKVKTLDELTRGMYPS